MRRETHALTKAQQEEIERLNVAAAEARITYEVQLYYKLELEAHATSLYLSQAVTEMYMHLY